MKEYSYSTRLRSADAAWRIECHKGRLNFFAARVSSSLEIPGGYAIFRLYPYLLLETHGVTTMKWQRDEWKDVSRKFCKRHDLPRGSKIVLIHTKKSGRQARNDRVVRHIRFKETELAPDHCTIFRFFEEYLAPTLSFDLSKHGLKPKLYGPNGEEPGGGTILKTVRRWSPQPTASQIEAHERREAKIEQIREVALSYVLEDEVDWEPELVCIGYLMALVDHYGEARVNAELDEAVSAASPI